MKLFFKTQHSLYRHKKTLIEGSGLNFLIHHSQQSPQIQTLQSENKSLLSIDLCLLEDDIRASYITVKSIIINPRNIMQK